MSSIFFILGPRCFNPRPPRWGERHLAIDGCGVAAAVSIRARPGGASDGISRTTNPAGRSFNPRPPRWGERRFSRRSCIPHSSFNPRPPRWGERPAPVDPMVAAAKFQSAPAPVGRATPNFTAGIIDLKVSIRARPGGASDAFARGCVSRTARFNPRPPRWGERLPTSPSKFAGRAFQSAPAPVGRATFLVGSDQGTGEFQSAPAPVGRATRPPSDARASNLFQSAPAPVGRATLAGLTQMTVRDVSIRARPGGASDSLHSGARSVPLGFNPRPPRWGERLCRPN